MKRGRANGDVNGDNREPGGSLETSRHLFQAPLYQPVGSSTWARDFEAATREAPSKLTWDAVSVLSILGLTYTVGDRTLVEQITRQPWLAEVGKTARLAEIPAHDQKWSSYASIATNLLNDLQDEARKVCAGRRNIYVLLSGGLDSRIGAGVLGRLHREGSLSCRPVAVTWGTPTSRDVVYGRAVAEHLRFDWQHVPLGPEVLLDNIEASATRLGGLVAPHHLHGMLWFANAPADSLVIACSYGDGVGRAEFCGQHVLELSLLRPTGAFGLVKSGLMHDASRSLRKELEKLRTRVGGQPRHVMGEIEMEAHYMRNMIGQAMSVIGQFCTTYQLFTSPEVYSNIWAMHPSIRTDKVYAEVLDLLDPKLARMPWARTNRSIRGMTIGADRHLERDYHDYVGWVRGPLFSELRKVIDPDWFEQTGIFDAAGIRKVEEASRLGEERYRGTGRAAYEVWLWLATFRRLSERLEELGKSVSLEAPGGDQLPAPKPERTVQPSALRVWLRSSSRLYRLARRARLINLRRRALREYPPTRADG